MKLITRDIGYAVSALCFIARNEKRKISVSELAKNLKIPRHFLRKIMQRLSKGGIVRSYKGQGGGFVLAQASKRIFLVELIEMFQGPISLSDCIFKKRVCPSITTCKLKGWIGEIENYVIDKLKNITLASLIRRRK